MATLKSIKEYKYFNRETNRAFQPTYCVMNVKCLTLHVNCIVMYVMQEPQGEQCCALMLYSWVNMT